MHASMVKTLIETRGFLRERLEVRAAPAHYYALQAPYKFSTAATRATSHTE